LCNFVVGQQVVCINADPNVPENFGCIGNLDGLREGNIYTISDLFIHPNKSIVCVSVKEIPGRTKCPDGFFYWRFRAMKKKQTDISSLKALLNTTKILEDA
jgi:hypothetical protein